VPFRIFHEQNQSTEAIPFELAAAAGVALGLSGQFPVVIIALVAWFILRRIKPNVPSSVMLVTSLHIGTALLACLGVAMGLAPLPVVVEVTAVSIIVLLLFFTGKPTWA
jgi:hypothetical protein